MSRAAVSKALRRAPGVSAEMHRRVTAAITELQYRSQVAARALRGRSRTLGVLTPHQASPLATQAIASFTHALGATPYDLLMRPCLTSLSTSSKRRGRSSITGWKDWSWRAPASPGTRWRP
ncbi:LacI family DNA-binding transcriptional regulator [Actinoplanes sp. OR16]|uniref:LacI family DNA-binding transcriptional regulator n=1 Tax=Actinoplanes sp. OR16 TaxID=946334 RepID=UPI000FDBB668|nr:LacI family DNA-binding transcriptional regulator [Actinoplanes sp. OR16]